MSDEMDVLFDHRLRSALHAASLPPAPATLRDALDDLPRTAATPRRVVPHWLALGAVAAGFGIVALLLWGAVFGQRGVGPGGASTPTPTASALPQPSPSAEPAGSRATFPAFTAGQLLKGRADGSIGGERVMLLGYYSEERRSPVPCPSFGGAELELSCADLRQGIADTELALAESLAGYSGPTNDPVVHPFWPPALSSDREASDLFDLMAAAGTGYVRPIFVTVLGHFDDPRAADCPAGADPPCADRFVIEDVVSLDYPAAASADAAAPSATPFPVDSPPPPPSWMANCTQPRDPDSAQPDDPVDPALSSEGWVSKSEVPFDFPTNDQVPAMVYFGIVEGAIPLGIWIDDPALPGQRYRWWGTATCVATDEWISYGWLPGTTYRVYEDGRRIDGGDPFDPLPTPTPMP